MKKFKIYFVDCEGFSGTVIWQAKNITEIKKQLKQYINAWNLAPIGDLSINEIY